ncbi:immunity 8 family protein [Burkholderia cepacia]|nr:immunity 8 family protein [Burkholderia cepacia]
MQSISSDEFEINSYAPENPACFVLNLRIRIGNDETSGADDFELCVCTPAWLSQTVWEPSWGRHLLIVREYDLLAIEKCINEYVDGCSGNDWSSIAGKLGRVLAWEFEDYQE